MFALKSEHLKYGWVQTLILGLIMTWVVEFGFWVWVWARGCVCFWRGLGFLFFLFLSFVFASVCIEK